MISLLGENFEQNSRFFVDKIVEITHCSVEEGRRVLNSFCEMYSSSTFTKNEVLSVLLRTLCKSNDNYDSQPMFFSTPLGQLFWRIQCRKLYDIVSEVDFIITDARIYG